MGSVVPKLMNTYSTYTVVLYIMLFIHIFVSRLMGVKDEVNNETCL